jgi:signal transduction histidine kinase
MTASELTDRLAGLPNMRGIPRHELEWLAACGEHSIHQAGVVMARKGDPIDGMYIVLSGHCAIRVDRGAGPRRVLDWRTGDVSGLLPYSRMTATPGDMFVEQQAEFLMVDRKHFPEMIRQCPEFTALTVHMMLDRARDFSASDLQDEKMISLGKLAAGLAHELNNPASAAVRGAKLLSEGLARADGAARALGAAGLTEAQLAAIDGLRTACLTHPLDAVLSPIQQADREDAIEDWLERRGMDSEHAEPLAATSVTLETLDSLASSISGEALAKALGWIAAGCTTHALAADIEGAATRIHELVGAVKRFTYMDNLAVAESVDVESGLRDTLRVVASKARSKGVAVGLDIEADLPPASAVGSELNQVWLNLIDNALDAVAESGQLEISARRELDRIVVRVVDDGPGIPPETLPHIFDPFFTTKPPGQGTGMGLDIARRLVRRYRGEIVVDSRPGRTEFCVSLVMAVHSAS